MTSLQIALLVSVLCTWWFIRYRAPAGLFAATGAVLALVLFFMELVAQPENQRLMWAYLVAGIVLGIMAAVFLMRRNAALRDPREKIQKKLSDRDVLMPVGDPTWARTCWRTGRTKVRVQEERFPRPVLFGFLEHGESETFKIPVAERKLLPEMGVLLARWLNRPRTVLALMVLVLLVGLLGGWIYGAIVGTLALLGYIVATIWLRRREGFRLRWVAADRSWMVVRFYDPNRAEKIRQELGSFFGTGQPPAPEASQDAEQA